MQNHNFSVTDVENIRIADYDYPLPDEQVAKHPLSDRDSCRLLVSRTPEEVLDTGFSELIDIISSDTLLIRNDTRVINARVRFVKESGANIEVFLLEPIDPHDYEQMFQIRNKCVWASLIGNLKRWKSGILSKRLSIDGKEVLLTAMRGESLPGNAHQVTFEWSDSDFSFAEVIEAAGYIPIPPYLHRDSEDSDSQDYQTVYARAEGSVAAPTAGLHFTPQLFDRLIKHGVDVESVTLHVGAGTFQPVKSDAIGDHPMHTETFSINQKLLIALISALKTGKKVLAIGTTSVRTLESLPYLGRAIFQKRDPLVSQWEAYREPINNPMETLHYLIVLLEYMVREHIDDFVASTAIMIAPGFYWNIVDAMVTNFHQPQSTLLLLVSSFLGLDEQGNPRWQALYNHALDKGYRFLSYGDACYFEKTK